VTIIRSADAYVLLARQAGQDSRLSLRARGVVYFVMSLPPEQDGHLTDEWIGENVPDGPDAVRDALAELERYGYYYRRARAGDGKGGPEWVRVMSDTPAGSQRDPEAA
jgi:hypothetical protein